MRAPLPSSLQNACGGHLRRGRILPRVGAEGNQGDLWGAVETKRGSDGADAAIDVELQVSEPEPALDILLSQFGQDHRAQERQANLASVGVAAQHEANRAAGWMIPQVVGVVRSMAHEQDRLAGLIADWRGDGQIGVRAALGRIVKTSQPDSGAAALDGHAGVAKHRDAIGRECGRGLCAPHQDLMVSEDSKSQFAVERVKKVGALPCGVDGTCSGTDTVADEIAGEQHGVRLEAVHLVDGVAKEKRLSEFVEVDIGEMRDPPTVEGCGQAGENDGMARDLNPVAFNAAGVQGQRGGSKDACFEQTPSPESVGRRGIREGHGQFYPRVGFCGRRPGPKGTAISTSFRGLKPPAPLKVMYKPIFMPAGSPKGH